MLKMLALVEPLDARSESGRHQPTPIMIELSRHKKSGVGKLEFNDFGREHDSQTHVLPQIPLKLSES
jgi:hypothetical protein